MKRVYKLFLRDNQEGWQLTNSLKMAVPLLSVHTLPYQCLLHLHPMHTGTRLTPPYLPRPHLVIVLIKGAVRNLPFWLPWYY